MAYSSFVAVKCLLDSVFVEPPVQACSFQVVFALLVHFVAAVVVVAAAASPAIFNVRSVVWVTIHEGYSPKVLARSISC